MDQIVSYAKEENYIMTKMQPTPIGAKYNGKSCSGTFGEFGSYSFQGARVLVTDEGGMLVTDSVKLYIKAKKYGIKEGIPIKHFGSMMLVLNLRCQMFRQQLAWGSLSVLMS